jgi:hypothetical protein
MHFVRHDLGALGGVMGVPMKWGDRQDLRGGHRGSGFCAEAAPSGVIAFFMAVAPYSSFGILLLIVSLAPHAKIRLQIIPNRPRFLNPPGKPPKIIPERPRSSQQWAVILPARSRK